MPNYAPLIRVPIIRFQNQTKGLLGTWNFNQFDDFTLPDGNVMNLDRSNFRDYHTFGMFCKYK